MQPKVCIAVFEMCFLLACLNVFVEPLRASQSVRLRVFIDVDAKECRGVLEPSTHKIIYPIGKKLSVKLADRQRPLWFGEDKGVGDSLASLASVAWGLHRVLQHETEICVSPNLHIAVTHARYREDVTKQPRQANPNEHLSILPFTNLAPL